MEQLNAVTIVVMIAGHLDKDVVRENVAHRLIVNAITNAFTVPKMTRTVETS